MSNNIDLKHGLDIPVAGKAAQKTRKTVVPDVIAVKPTDFKGLVPRLLVKEGDKKPIIINITDGNMELKINSAVGSMNEDVDIAKEGKDLMIGFNPKFLIDALRVIDDEEISIYLVNPKAPCFIRNEEESYIYLILPVNFNSVR